MNMTFGDKLKQIRIDRKLSQEDIANLLGTSKQVISRYETNQRIPKITTVNEYAQLLRVPLNYLLDNSITGLSQNIYEAPIIGAHNGGNTSIATGNHSVAVNASLDQPLSSQEQELLRIYKILSPKLQIKLISFAYELEEQQ